MVVATSVRDGSDTAEHGCATGRHRLYVVGYLRGPRPTWLDCERPLRVLCRDCDYETRWRCDGHRASRCQPCSARYRRRVGRIAESGTRRTSGYQYLLTCTAPGERLHCLVRGCQRAPSCEHQLCDCTPEDGINLAEWNPGHSDCWNLLRTNLRRAYPRLEYMRGIEVQERGALHDHAILWSPAPISLHVVKKFAMRAGFGHAVDLKPLEPGASRAAAYVSKRVAGYITKATDSRTAVPWLPAGTEDDGQYLIGNASGEVLGRSPSAHGAPYRTWSCSRGWGLTMAAVRADAKAYVESRTADGLAEVLSLLAAELEAVPIDGVPPPPS